MFRHILLNKAPVLILSAFFLGPRCSPAQQSLPMDEKKVTDKVAEILAHVREQNRLPGIRRIDDHHVRVDACSRAKRGDDSSGRRYGAAGDKVGTLSVFWYSTVDPNQPPPELLQFAKGPEHQYEQPHRFAVGACVIPKNGNAEARYWIEVRTYMGAVKSSFYRAVWD